MFTHTHNGLLFREFVAAVVKNKRARSYLEVGVRDGATLALIDCDAVGVDPFFQFTVNPMGAKKSLQLFQETSDEFFRHRNVKALVGGTLDVVFLDGLHQFEYLLRDFINSEKNCHRDSLIMLDDCLPTVAEMTEREHRPSERKNHAYASWWTGDVWKLIPILKRYRPDLRVTLVDTQPTGNVCITNLDPNSTALEDNYYVIIDEYMAISNDDASLSKLYSDNSIVSSSAVLQGFSSSLYIGP